MVAWSRAWGYTGITNSNSNFNYYPTHLLRLAVDGEVEGAVAVLLGRAHTGQRHLHLQLRLAVRLQAHLMRAAPRRRGKRRSGGCQL